MQLPQADEYFLKSYGDVYQRNILLFALAHCSQWRRAVDIGAHVGYLAKDMSPFFSEVHAFEPVPWNRECLQQNVPKNVKVYDVALGAEQKRVGLVNQVPANSGGWAITEGDAAQMVTLDSLELDEIDFIKIDVQGYEREVLTGAVRTLKRCKPVVLLEVSKDAQDAKNTVQLMKGLGAKASLRMREDIVFTWGATLYANQP